MLFIHALKKDEVPGEYHLADCDEQHAAHYFERVQVTPKFRVEGQKPVDRAMRRWEDCEACLSWSTSAPDTSET